MQDEEWRAIPGFEGVYAVSDRGRVISYKKPGRPRELVGGMVAGKYRNVLLSGGPAGRRCRKVHVLVAEAFLGPRPDGMEVRHLNGDSTDNRAANLAYGTPRENRLDAVRHGTHPQTRKTHCKNGHPYDAENTQRVASNPAWRRCRACRQGGSPRRPVEQSVA